MMKEDSRFDTLFENLEKFDALKRKMRRNQNFLQSAIERAWRDAGRTNLLDYHGVGFSFPIGERICRITVEARVRIDSPTQPFEIRLVDSDGVELNLDKISLHTLQALLTNSSPMIDAAAKLCDMLGCLVMFKINVGRFYPHMEYHI